MSRKLRIEFPDACYHVISRGDRREAIFLDDRDRRLFLRTLTEACEKTGWQVHAYCLMGNHFHLIIETPKGELVAGMKWLLCTYTMRFNTRHSVVGHLFSGRYKAIIVDSRNSGYLRKVCDYVHLNPVRASLLNSEEPLRQYTWSSFPAYLRSPRQRPPWLRVDRLLGEVGIPSDTKAGRQHFEKVMELARREDTRESVSELEQGWCLGDPEFRKELYPQIEARRRPSHSGPELRESASEAAEKRIQDALQQLGLSEEDLQARPKGDPVKVEIAHRLRTKTTMTLQWIATRLYMGTGHSLSNLLSRHRKQQAKAAMGRKKPSG